MCFILMFPHTEASVSITRSDQQIFPNRRLSSSTGLKNCPPSRRTCVSSKLLCSRTRIFLIRGLLPLNTYMLFAALGFIFISERTILIFLFANPPCLDTDRWSIRLTSSPWPYPNSFLTIPKSSSRLPSLCDSSIPFVNRTCTSRIPRTLSAGPSTTSGTNLPDA